MPSRPARVRRRCSRRRVVVALTARSAACATRRRSRRVRRLRDDQPFDVAGRLSARHGERSAAAANFRWTHRAGSRPADARHAARLDARAARRHGGERAARAARRSRGRGAPTGRRSPSRSARRADSGARARVVGARRCRIPAARTRSSATRAARASVLRQDGWEIVYGYGDGAATRPRTAAAHLSGHRAAPRARRVERCALMRRQSTIRALTVAAPAKVNLFLHVVGPARRRLPPDRVAVRADRPRRHGDAHARRDGAIVRDERRRRRARRATTSPCAPRGCCSKRTGTRAGVAIRDRQAHPARRGAGRRELGRGERAARRSTGCGASTLSRAELAALGAVARRRRSVLRARRERVRARHRRARRRRYRCRGNGLRSRCPPTHVPTARDLREPGIDTIAPRQRK